MSEEPKQELTADKKPVVKSREVKFVCPNCQEVTHGDIVDAFSNKSGVDRHMIKAGFVCKNCGYQERSRRVTIIAYGDKGKAKDASQC